MICNNCGKEIPDNAGFCSYCGNKIEILEGEAPEERIPEIEAPVVNPHHKDNVSDLAGHINIKKPEINKEAIKDAYKNINMKKVVPIVAACVVVFIVIVAIAIPKNEVKEAKVSSTPSIHAESKVAASVSSVASTVESKPEKEEVKPNITAQYEIKKAITNFEGKRALVEFYENEADKSANRSSYAVIDREGYIVWSVLPEQVKEKYNISLNRMSFNNGTYCIYGYPEGLFGMYTYEAIGMTIINEYGDVLFDSSNDPDKDVTYHYLGSGDGVYLVEKRKKNFTTNESYLVEMDRLGTIIYEQRLSSEMSSLGKAEYLGDALFKIDSLVYDKNSKKIKTVGVSIIDVISSEETLVRSVNNDYVVNTKALYSEEEEIITDNTTKVDIGIYAAYGEGLFNYVKDYSNTTKGIYDYKGNLLVAYPKEWEILHADRFSGGYAALKLRGADKKAYVTVVDKKGEMLYDPVLADGLLDSWHGYVWAEKGGDRIILDTEGKEISKERMKEQYEDFTLLYVSAPGVSFDVTVREGFEILDKEYVGTNGKSIKTIYKVSNFKEIADKNINPSGVQGTQPSTSVNSQSSNASATQRDYKNIDNFNIKGKWKNVGTGTFGQAQSGAIISFDGKNCNFFSPNDTYAFYKKGSDYTLDCTSPLSSTVTSTVKIVDENNIDIIRGSTIIELKRVS